MDIHNIALVRATNHIPFDGEIKTVGNSVMLSKDSYYQFSFSIGDLLEQLGRIPTYDQVKEDMMKKGEISKDDDLMEVYGKCSDRSAKVKSIIKSDYLPYLGGYNSMLLFSLNGLVPDDDENGGMGGNVFSDKECAIIDGLEEHIDEIISLNPTDTAINGNVTLSDNAIILISRKKYESLTDKQKADLEKLPCKKVIFEGTLKEAVQSELEKSERYTSEELTLSRIHIKPSETSNEIMEILNQISEERGLSQAYHFDILSHRTELKGGLEDVKDESEKADIISDYYMNQFYYYMFEKMDIDLRLQYSLINYKSAKPYTEELCKKIKEYGIDKYKELVQGYNRALEELRDSGKLPTGEEILASLEEGKPINIAAMVEEHITGQKPSPEFGIPSFVREQESQRENSIEENNKDFFEN